MTTVLGMQSLVISDSITYQTHGKPSLQHCSRGRLQCAIGLEVMTTESGAVGMYSLRGALFRRLAISIFGMESVRRAEC